MRTKSKGISIVFIPARGNTITLLVSPLYLYLLFITVFALVFFSTQFFTKLRQVKLNYIAVSSFSEDEKQQLLSEELSVVQDELTAINTIHLANKAMTGTIATLDKENRKKLSLREYNFEYAVNTKNQHLSSINVSLNPSSVLTFKEKVTTLAAGWITPSLIRELSRCFASLPAGAASLACSRINPTSSRGAWLKACCQASVLQP